MAAQPATALAPIGRRTLIRLGVVATVGGLAAACDRPIGPAAPREEGTSTMPSLTKPDAPKVLVA